MSASAPLALRRLTGADAATIVDVWRARVAATPTAPFLRFAEQTWTYAEAWAAILAAARGLREAGCAPGKRVASYLGNRPETLWTWFGTLLAGGIYCPLNRAHKGELLAAMIARVAPDLIVVDPEVGAAIAALAPTIPQMPPFAGAVSDPIGLELARPALDDDALVIFTSGTTGGSKAARLSHRLFTHQAGRVVDAWQMTEADVFHGWLPHFHVAGTLHQTLATVIAGSRLALFERFSASGFLDEVRSVGATIVIGLPNVVNILWGTRPGPADANPIRLMISTTVNPDIQPGFEARFGLRLLEQYGMTEAELITLPSPDEDLPARSCGRVSDDWELVILGSDGAPAQPQTVGEICVRPRVRGVFMSGYHGDDTATVAACRDLWFHTGDFGKLDAQGYLYFADRERHVIRRRSENISSLELERLVERLPMIAEAAAVGVPSPLGEEDVKLIVTLAPGAQADPAAIRAACGEIMARFMVPRYVRIIDQFPRTDVGKIAKEKLRTLDGHEHDGEALPGETQKCA